MNRLILGIDGGGSNTRALLAGPDGAVLGRGFAPSSNFQSVGFPAAAAAIQQAIVEAFGAAGVALSLPVAALCLGLAGVGRPADRARMEAWAGSQRIAERCIVVTDAEPVLAAGTPAGWGVALISGTGSVCFGRAPQGDTLQVGGWGYLLGDEGSGYDLAVRALRLATRTADGRADAHALLAAILSHLSLEQPEALVRRVYGGDTSPAAIAALAQPVVALAEAGDTHALALLAEGAGQLALMAKAAAHKLELAAAPLALAGGLLGASAALRRMIGAELGAAWEPVTYVDEPARGTLLLARRLLES